MDYAGVAALKTFAARSIVPTLSQRTRKSRAPAGVLAPERFAPTVARHSRTPSTPTRKPQHASIYRSNGVLVRFLSSFVKR
jgi:hypothetical protein